MAGSGSLTLLKVRGIPVRLHFTFLLVLPYLAWVIGKATPALAQLANVAPGELLVPRYLMGTLLAVGLFAGVLFHELSHVFVGLRGGARFAGVTLMLVGGVSEVLELPKRPRHEAAMAVAGPLASAVLGALCLAAYTFIGPADARYALHYLAYVNFALAIFNLVPAFPMDGGRILRALLAMVTNRVRATQIASWAGQAMALLFLAAGFYTFNWLLGLVGVLVIVGARAELAAVKASEEIGGLTVREAMQRFPPTVDVSDRLSQVAERMERELKGAYFVLSRGEYVGLVTMAEVIRVRGSAEMAFATAGEVMRSDLPQLTPGQDLAMAARLLRGSDVLTLPVVDGGVLVGSLSQLEIAHALREREKEKALALPREREAT